MKHKKKLYKSTTDKKLCGVCAGIANYFGIDSTIVRLVYTCVTLLVPVFPGIILYIAMAFILPEDNGMIDTDGYDIDGQ